MKYVIDGGNLPVLKVKLEQGETIQCESGAMSWMDDEIEMQTEAGGLGKMFGRMLTNEHAFLNTYHAKCDGEIAFSSKFPGSIRGVEVTADNGIVVQKGSFLASFGNLTNEVYIQKKIGGGLFGGEGLFNTVVYGPGKVTLQSMPISATALQLYQYMPHPTSN